MDVFLDILVEVLNNLNFSNGYRDIRKITKSKFLRGVLYVAQGAATFLFAVVLAAVLFLLLKFAGFVFEMFI